MRLPTRLGPRVVLFDADSRAAPPILNPLEGDDAARAVDNLVGIFSRIYAASWGPRTDDILRAGLLTLRAMSGPPLLSKSIPGPWPVRRRTEPGPSPDSPVGPDPARFPTGPDRFDVVIATADPNRTAWLAAVSWDHLLAQPGLLILITHSDHTGSLSDPLGRLIAELRGSGLAYHDRLIVVSGPAPTCAAKRDRGSDESGLSVRTELLLFASPTRRHTDREVA